MKKKQKTKNSKKAAAKKPRKPISKKWRWPPLILLALIGLLALLTQYESYTSLYDAYYIGNEECGTCHNLVYKDWENSPHALMTRPPSSESVVGDFENHQWYLPEEYQKSSLDTLPAARMYHRNNKYFMDLRKPGSESYQSFPIEYVIGYQYRQVYLTRERGGVLRRLPLQWSNSRDDFFPYWNFQEQSEQSVQDLHAQMTSMNSAWNLFCARCHTTNLEIVRKNRNHTFAETRWTNDGIGCESCHGPGSQHRNYFAGNYVNRVVAFLNSAVRGQPAAYIATAPKLTKGEDLSVCARCHGPDIMMSSTDLYRRYEPGYSRLGRINDLSKHFKEFPLQPGRTEPTVECWEDGRPKGIGMLFRSFIESECYTKSEVRCYNCHNPHNNKKPTATGVLKASEVSDGYCLSCHPQIADEPELHTKHVEGTEGSFCYDCHMPRHIMNLVSGTEKFSRTHTMSSIPNPAATLEHGVDGSPNACNDCHDDKSAQWAIDKMEELWPSGSFDLSTGSKHR